MAPVGMHSLFGWQKRMSNFVTTSPLRPTFFAARRTNGAVTLVWSRLKLSTLYFFFSDDSVCSIKCLPCTENTSFYRILLCFQVVVQFLRQCVFQIKPDVHHVHALSFGLHRRVLERVALHVAKIVEFGSFVVVFFYKQRNLNLVPRLVKYDTHIRRCCSALVLAHPVEP